MVSTPLDLGRGRVGRRVDPRAPDRRFDGRRTRIVRPVTDLPEPDTSKIELTDVLGALADEGRLIIVRELAAQGEAACGTIELGVSKATRSHHFKVLRESGLTRTRVEGTRRWVSLRRDDLDLRFPGLLDALLAAQPAA